MSNFKYYLDDEGDLILERDNTYYPLSLAVAQGVSREFVEKCGLGGVSFDSLEEATQLWKIEKEITPEEIWGDGQQ